MLSSPSTSTAAAVPARNKVIIATFIVASLGGGGEFGFQVFKENVKFVKTRGERKRGRRKSERWMLGTCKRV